MNTIPTPTVVMVSDEQLKTLTRDQLIDLLNDYQRVEDCCQQMWEKISTLVLEMDSKEQ